MLAAPALLVIWALLPEERVPEPPSVASPALAPASPRAVAPQPQHASAEAPSARTAAAFRPSAQTARERAVSQQTTPASADVTPDGLRIAPANDGEPHEPGMLPHPITPQHERIFRENALVASLNGAMDVKDAKGLRALLEAYREEYPEDAHVLQDGYAIIADCLENPGPKTRAVAQRYYDEELASGLRRYIRRHCLEN